MPMAVEVIGRVPVLDDIESLVDPPLNLSQSKVIAEKDRLFSVSNFGKRFVRRLRHIVGVCTRSPYTAVSLSAAKKATT
jgi:hypothetical protein